MNTTRVITSDAYLNNFTKSVKEVSSNVSLLIHDNSIFINSRDRIFYLDRLSEALQCLEYKELLTKIIVDILIKQSLEAFESSPFFSDFSILYSIELLKILLVDKASEKDPVQILDSFEQKIFSKISNCASVGTSSDFFCFVNKLQRSLLSIQLIENSCRYAGLDGKIFIETNQESHSTLEVKNSYGFEIETFDEFFFQETTWNHSFVNCIVIDGVIESVSEVHHLLEHASKNIDPVVLIGRGFGNDVLQTLYMNMKRKTLNVMPIKLKNDEALINSFVDISVVAKTDPVSYLKGELISSIDYDQTSVVEHIEIKKGKLLIVNSAAVLPVRRHLERLRKNIESKRENLDPYRFNLYENSIRKRIRSLSSRSVHISLSKDLDTQTARKIKKDIDCGLRTVPIVRDHGMTSIKKLESAHDQNDLKDALLIDTINIFFKGTKNIPTGALVKTIKACHENLKLLILTSGALIYENSQKPRT
jgi:hypothetical protein